MSSSDCPVRGEEVRREEVEVIALEHQLLGQSRHQYPQIVKAHLCRIHVELEHFKM